MDRRQAEVRREEILRATAQVVANKRIRQNQGGGCRCCPGNQFGLIFYHFETKERLLSEAFSAGNATDLETLQATVSGPGSFVQRLATVIRLYLPTGSAEAWSRDVDAWSEGLYTDEIRQACQRNDQRWRSGFAALIAEGAGSGECRSDDPEAAALRLTVMLDGLAVASQVRGTLGRKDAARWAASYVADVLGMETELLVAAMGDVDDVDDVDDDVSPAISPDDASADAAGRAEGSARWARGRRTGDRSGPASRWIRNASARSAEPRGGQGRSGARSGMGGSCSLGLPLPDSAYRHERCRDGTSLLTFQSVHQCTGAPLSPSGLHPAGPGRGSREGWSPRHPRARQDAPVTSDPGPPHGSHAPPAGPSPAPESPSARDETAAADPAPDHAAQRAAADLAAQHTAEHAAQHAAEHTARRHGGGRGLVAGLATTARALLPPRTPPSTRTSSRPCRPAVGA